MPSLGQVNRLKPIVDCEKLDILSTLHQFECQSHLNLLISMEGKENHLWGAKFDPTSLSWWYFSNDEIGHADLGGVEQGGPQPQIHQKSAGVKAGAESWSRVCQKKEVSV
jgi:hypothetical protein